MYPRSAFWYRGSVFVPSFQFLALFRFLYLVLVFGVQEHLPKPPFWKAPFCEPPKLRPIQKRTQVEFLQSFFSSSHEAVVVPSAIVAKNMCFLHSNELLFLKCWILMVASVVNLVAWFARIDSRESRESPDSRASEIRVIRANWPDAL